MHEVQTQSSQPVPVLKRSTLKEPHKKGAVRKKIMVDYLMPTASHHVVFSVLIAL
jgi:hypothetical protein